MCELGGLDEHDLLLRGGDGDVGRGGESTIDESQFDLVDDHADIQDNIITLQRYGTVVASLQERHQTLLQCDVCGIPQLFELVRSHEAIDDLGDQGVDRAGDDGDEGIQRRPLGEQVAEDLRHDGLGVDLLLDLVREEDGEGILYFRVVGEGAHGLDVTL